MPTKIYVKDVLRIASEVNVKGAVHVTGGGFQENIPRVLPHGLGVHVARGTWTIPTLFQWLQHSGGVAEEEMFRTFNMGVGMILVMTPQDADTVRGMYPEGQVSVIGEVMSGDKQVTFK